MATGRPANFGGVVSRHKALTRKELAKYIQLYTKLHRPRSGRITSKEGKRFMQLVRRLPREPRCVGNGGKFQFYKGDRKMNLPCKNCKRAHARL